MIPALILLRLIVGLVLATIAILGAIVLWVIDGDGHRAIGCAVICGILAWAFLPDGDELDALAEFQKQRLERDPP